jgi:hypothetical protein
MTNKQFSSSTSSKYLGNCTNFSKVGDEIIAQSLIENPALGNISKSCSSITGISSPVVKLKLDEEMIYKLQDQSSKLLKDFGVSFCGKCKVDNSKQVEVLRSNSTGKFKIGNVKSCSLLYVCAFCSKVIIEGRRQELLSASKAWKSEGGSLMMMTTTNSHKLTDDLKHLLKLQGKAHSYFWSSRVGKALRDRLMMKGRVTGLEETYTIFGGHHPHKHALLFVKDNELNTISYDYDYLMSSLSQGYLSDFQLLYLKLKIYWIISFTNFYKSSFIKKGRKALIAMIKCKTLTMSDIKYVDEFVNFVKGLDYNVPDLRHGLDLKGNDYAESYIAKISFEMTYNHTKTSRNGYSPFEILYLSIENKPLPNGRLPSAIFREYAEAFKYKRQLVWSDGLKDYFGINDKTDEQLIEDTTEDYSCLFKLPDDFWWLIIRAKKRYEFLKAVEHDYLNNLLCCDTGQLSKFIDLL